MNLQQAIKQNWSKESSAYSQSVREDLDTEKRTAWTNLILQYAPSKERLDFLDIGTGPGFFPIILTKAGHHVTGIDCVEDMLLEAKKMQRQSRSVPPCCWLTVTLFLFRIITLIVLLAEMLHGR